MLSNFWQSSATFSNLWLLTYFLADWPYFGNFCKFVWHLVNFSASQFVSQSSCQFVNLSAYQFSSFWASQLVSLYNFQLAHLGACELVRYKIWLLLMQFLSILCVPVLWLFWIQHQAKIMSEVKVGFKFICAVMFTYITGNPMSLTCNLHGIPWHGNIFYRPVVTQSAQGMVAMIAQVWGNN